MILEVHYEVNQPDPEFLRAKTSAEEYFAAHPSLYHEPRNKEETLIYQTYKEKLAAIPDEEIETVTRTGILVQIHPGVAEYTAIVRENVSGDLHTVLAHQIKTTKIYSEEDYHAKSSALHNQSPGGDLQTGDDPAPVRSGVLSPKANPEKG